METSNPVHHEHVPQTQKFVNYLLYAAAGLSVLVLALCAYVLSVYSNVFLWGDILNPALGLTIFSCILTWIFVAAYFLLPRFAPQWYQKWAILGAFALTAFFWLVSWALLASRVSATSYLNNIGNYYSSFGLRKRFPEPKRGGSSSSSSFSSSYYDTYDKKYSTAWKVAAAAAGIGALTWVLIVVALVFFTLAVLAHQNAGAAEYDQGEPKPMPPAAPGLEMNNYQQPIASPAPEQQFAHNQQYGGQQQYDQSAYQQNQAYQQPQHQIPT